jgi:hypothetical protein
MDYWLGVLLRLWGFMAEGLRTYELSLRIYKFKLGF